MISKKEYVILSLKGMISMGKDRRSSEEEVYMAKMNTCSDPSHSRR